MDDFLTMQHSPLSQTFSMYLIDAYTKDFITGFYLKYGPIPQIGDLIQIDNDNVYEVEKRLFEVKRGDDKKKVEVRFTLLVRYSFNNQLNE